ncbi:MAG: HEAT repeat domain-containing protein [Planctomycetota bacterium]
MPDAPADLSTPAPWPFLLYIAGPDSEATARIEKEVFGTTGSRLASHLCKFVRITPDEAADLRYLRQLPRLRNPMIVVVSRDWTVVGALAKPRRCTFRNCWKLMAEAVDGSYAVSLNKYVDSLAKILDREERLWKSEQKLIRAKLRAESKKGGSDTSALEKIEKKGAEIRDSLQELAEEEAQLRATVGLTNEQQLERQRTTGLTREQKEACRSFRKLAETDHPVGRALAIEALRGHDAPAIVQIILREVRTGNSWTTWEAGRLLGQCRTAASLEMLVDVLENGTARERVAVLHAFGHRSHPAAVPALLRLSRKRNLAERSAAITALAAQEDADSGTRLVEALKDPDPEVRSLAVEGITRRRLRDRMEALYPLLTDDDWSVRKTTLEALGTFHEKDGIPQLIERFKKEQGILREVCHASLVRLTGKTLLHNSSDWAKWWYEEGSSFRMPANDVVEKAQVKVGAALRAKPWANATRHHGIDTYSRRVIFVIDVSSTMKFRMPLPPNATSQQKKLLWRGNKLDLAKDELVRTLETIGKDVEFNIIAFSGTTKAWRKKPGNASHLRSAIRFVQHLKPHLPPPNSRQTDRASLVGPGRTHWKPSENNAHKRNLYDALMAAWGVLEDEPLGVRSRASYDTIYLMTGGPPEIGKILDLSLMTEVVQELNRTRGIVLHLVGFSRPTVHVLKPLAQVTGGRHVVHGH